MVKRGVYMVSAGTRHKADMMHIASLSNERVKRVVALRRRSRRDRDPALLIEGYRELWHAVEAGHPLDTLFVCPAWFLGANEPALIERCRAAGVAIVECAKPVFAKMAYRDRPEGLLALGAPLGKRFEDLVLPERPLLVVAEAIEKPGNLGTILRSADGAGAAALIVCDPRTDIDNPNVVRASIGLCFAVPIVQTDRAAALTWLRARGIRIVAATPHAGQVYTDCDFTAPAAILVGAEQVGLSASWLTAADMCVRIPMLGRADSLNVAGATTLLLYEAARQRGWPPRGR